MVSGIHTTWTTCSRHNTSRLTEHCVRVEKIVSKQREPFGFWCHAWENFTRDQPWPGQLFRPSIRSHQQALGNHTDKWTPVALSPVTLLSSYFMWSFLMHGTRSQKAPFWWDTTFSSSMQGPVNRLVLWREHVVQVVQIALTTENCYILRLGCMKCA